MVLRRGPPRAEESHGVGYPCGLHSPWPRPPYPEFDAVPVFRFLEGFALGGVPALAVAYLNEEVNVLSAALAAGTYISGTTLGGLAGRIVAAPIGEMLHWRTGMLAVTVLSVAWPSPSSRWPRRPGALPRTAARSGRRSGHWAETFARAPCWSSTPRASC